MSPLTVFGFFCLILTSSVGSAVILLSAYQHVRRFLELAKWAETRYRGIQNEKWSDLR